MTISKNPVKLAIVDIDVTLADPSHREHYIQKEPPDWQSFVSGENLAKDPVVPHARRVLENLEELGWTIVFLTGRNERTRSTTREWLVEHLGLEVGFSCLIMRPLESIEVPTVYKDRELLKLYKELKPTVMMAFDDDLFMHSIYESYNALVFKAPECWEPMFPEAKELPPETAWRK